MQGFLAFLPDCVRKIIRSRWFPAVSGMLLIFLLCLPALTYDFLYSYDDAAHVPGIPVPVWTKENLARYCLHPVVNLYIPLPMLSFMAEKSLFGNNPLVFHLDNILLLCLCFLIFYGILREFHAGRVTALLFALLWALNPQKVESTIWITERKDLLCMTFALLGMYSFMKNRKSDGFSVMSGVWSALSILCKPAAAALPGIMLLVLFGLRRKSGIRYFIRKLTFPFILTGIALLWSMRIVSETRIFVLNTDWKVAVHNFFWYIATSIVPYETHPFYPPVTAWSECLFPGILCLLFAAVSIAVSVKIRIPLWKHILLLCCIAGIFVPVSGLAKYGDFHYCDRYTLMISAVLCAWFAVLVTGVLKKHPVFSSKTYGILILMVCGFAVLFRINVPHWKNDVSFASCIIEKPGAMNPHAYDLTAGTAARHPSSAVADLFLRRLETDLALKRSLIDARVSQFFFYSVSGLKASAENHFDESLFHFRKVMDICRNKKVVIQPFFTIPLFRKMIQVFYAAGDKENLLYVCKGLKKVEKDTGTIQFDWLDCVMAEAQGDDVSVLRELLILQKKYPEDIHLKEKIRFYRTKLSGKNKK